MSIKKIGLIGAGAVGSVYIKHLFNAFNDDFFVVANSDRASKIRQNGIKINNETIFPNIISDTSDFKLDLLIITVKNYQLEDSFVDIKSVIDDNTIILPLLNGITATDRIKSAFPNNKVLYGLVYITSDKSDGSVYSSDDGFIRFGEVNNETYSDSVLKVKEVFESAKIHFQIPKDMLSALWKKWVINIGSNQVSAIAGVNYGKLKSVYELQILMCNAMLEVVNVAEALGVDLSKEDIETYIEKTRGFHYNPNIKTSTLQDIQNKRQTEVEYFSGDLIRIAQRASVSVPVNETLYYFIKAIEKMY